MRTGYRLGRAALLLTVVLSLAPARADPDGRIEPIKPAAEGHPLTEIWSGYHYLSGELRASQEDDDTNPSRSLVEAGAELWSKVEGKQNKACESCHGNAAKSMRGVGARYPVFYPVAKKPIDLEGRINLCREKFMGARPWAPESKELLAMTIFVKRQSRGIPVTPHVDGPLADAFSNGRLYYTTRRGQLNLACTHCHNKNAGRKLRDETLSQGQTNGFPAYRKSWGETGSLLRQVNQCLARVRANPLQAGSDAFVNLELYLAWRGQGLPVETPAVRP